METPNHRILNLNLYNANLPLSSVLSYSIQ